MKTLIFIVFTLPFIVNAQLTPDSLLGCYAGTYMYKTEFDNDWTTVYADTIIVFNVDTNYVDYNGTIYEEIGLGWKLVNPNSGYRFEESYRGFCTYGFDFNQCIWSMDSMIQNFCDVQGQSLFFSNNDSVFFTHQCWKNAQTDPMKYIWFEGKKISSQLPDSLLHIDVEEITNNKPFAKIYPNPTSGIVNIELNNAINTYIEIYSITGKQLFNKEFNSINYTVNMKSFNKGIYFIKLTNNKNHLTTKIIYL